MSYRIAIAATQEEFTAETGETLLAAARRANVLLPHDCESGGCGTCRIRLIEGGVCYEDFPFGLTPEEEAGGYALACQGRPTSDLVIERTTMVASLPSAQRHTATVTGVTPLCDGITRLTVALPEGVPLEYRPGQYTNILVGEDQPRSFSMASAPAKGILDFHVRHVPGGRFTDRLLAQLRPGDRLDIELPLGSFVYRDADYRPLLMVATGTGIAPIKSILESLMDAAGCPPIHLYWGMRTAADLYLHEDIQTWTSRFDDFHYIPVLSRGGPLWEGRRGYVQDAVAADFTDLSEHAIYLCGSPAMIADAKQAFIARGASMEHFYAEGFTATGRATAFAHYVENCCDFLD